MKVDMRTWLVLAAGAALWLASCGDSHQSVFDKNTNWLRGCGSSDACGAGLQCVCGICTSVCDRDAQCAAHDEGAICVTPSINGGACTASETSAAARVCSLACKSSAACTEVNDALMCVEGACELAGKGSVDAGRDGAANHGRSDAGGAVLDDGGIATLPDSGAIEVPVQIEPEVGNAITAACGNGFACEAKVALPGSVKSILAGDDGFIYWTDWGSLDERGNHRKDGAIRRVAKTSNADEIVLNELETPWRVWLDAERMYWMNGEPGDFGVGPGMHTLFEIYRDGSTAPRALKTDPFWHMLMDHEVFMWQTSETVDGKPSTTVHRWHAHGTTVWTDAVTAGDYVLDGIDDTGTYMEDGGLSILFQSNKGWTAELVVHPTAFLATVGDDALWLIHTGSDKRDWVSSLPKLDGTLTKAPTSVADVTHLGSADGYYDRPLPGTSVVWLVTGEPGGSTWQLWSIPKAGGEREPAFSWPTESGHVRDDAPGPIWIADGDEIWVFANGALVRVTR